MPDVPKKPQMKSATKPEQSLWEGALTSRDIAGEAMRAKLRSNDEWRRKNASRR